ncbi:MAG: hypothetical protein DMG49_20310 [Acidobacteria bacterium]|nr:MAG: hypothetical protein DMG49_20310 [Acidobacteriota bacterium]
MAEIKKLQGTLKQLIDFFLADLVRSEELVQVEVRESAIGYTRGQECPQAAGINGSHFADFLENNALQLVFKNIRIKQLADLNASSALDQHRAEKAQGVFLELESCV